MKIFILFFRWPWESYISIDKLLYDIRGKSVYCQKNKEKVVDGKILVGYCVT